MKEQNGKKGLSRQRRLYWYTALGCVAVVLALVIVVTSVSLSNNGGENEVNNPPAVEDGGDVTPPVQNPDAEQPDNNDEPVVTTPEGFVLPIESASVTNDFGFFYNQTLNNYYEHEGLDFTAEVGEKVFAVDDGTIESVYTSDVLSGTEIIIDHGDGVKTVYRFVTAAEGLKAGMTVQKGDEIATVAEANGSEYKDGAHLHFEVLKNGKNVDPAIYLTMEEK